jgi:hypothetical protein
LDIIDQLHGIFKNRLIEPAGMFLHEVCAANEKGVATQMQSPHQKYISEKIREKHLLIRSIFLFCAYVGILILWRDTNCKSFGKL